MKAKNLNNLRTQKRRTKSAETERAEALMEFTGGAPRMNLVGDGNQKKISPYHPDKLKGVLLLMEAIGSKDADFFYGLLTQLTNVQGSGEVNEAALNFMLSIIKGIKPKDQVEAMLGAQMAAVHVSAMRLARVLAHVENIPQQDSAQRAFNALMRTFVSQMEALKRYRTGGEQKVTVQHVSVSEGGQAIVGNISQGQPSRSTGKQPTDSPPALADARIAPMPPIDDSKKRAPVRLRRVGQGK